MRLYQITSQDIETVLAHPDCVPEAKGGRYTVSRVLPGKFKGMPLKVIYALEGGSIVVLSAYPLKKRYPR